MNVPKIKGTHNAMKSAMLAAEAIWDKLEAGDSNTEGQWKKRVVLDILPFYIRYPAGYQI